MPPTAPTIPIEIFLLISQYLDQDDLLSCVLVCKEWDGALASTLFRNIRLSQDIGTYQHFTSREIICKVAEYSSQIQSIQSPHPSFVRLLLNAIAAQKVSPVSTISESVNQSKNDANNKEQEVGSWFLPKLTSLSVLYDEKIHQAVKVRIPQLQFRYLSDSDDSSDTDSEIDDGNEGDGGVEWKMSTNINTNQRNGSATTSTVLLHQFDGPLHDLIDGFERTRDASYLGHDPFGVIELIRKAPNLKHLEVDIRVLGHVGGLEHLLRPGVLPQRIEKLEIVTPEEGLWKANSYDDSDDEDYDPNLLPVRDVEEEYEEDESESDTEDDEQYDMDELVTWYHQQLIRVPNLPSFWSDFPEIDNSPMDPLLNLKHLVLTCPEETRRVLQKFLNRRCTNLKTLEFIDPSGHFCENLGHARNYRRDPFIVPAKNLIIRVDKNLDPCFSDEYLGCVLGAGDWESVKIEGFPDFGSIASWSILEDDFKSRLKVLDLGVQDGIVTPETIQAILVGANRLEVFSGRALYHLATTIVGPDTDLMVQAPTTGATTVTRWGCEDTLRVFRCQILLTVPQLADTQDPSFENSGESAEEVEQQHQYRRRLQRAVMTQLGQCHNLEELDLSHYQGGRNDQLDQPFGQGGRFNIARRTHQILNGVRIVTPLWTKSFQGDTNNNLEFSIATGLVRLEKLKNLKRLNMKGLGHQVSVTELKWMKEVWPQLESFEGLLAEDNELGEEGTVNEEKRKQRELEIRNWIYGNPAVESNRSFWKTSKHD